MVNEKVENALTLLEAFAKELSSTWFRDIVFFVLITCEIFASHLYINQSIVLNTNTIIILSGFSIYWYTFSYCKAFVINFFINILNYSADNKAKQKYQSIHNISFFVNGLVVFSSTLLLLFIKHFILIPKQHLMLIFIYRMLLIIISYLVIRLLVYIFKKIPISTQTN